MSISVQIPIQQNFAKLSSGIETYQNLQVLYENLKKVEDKDSIWKLGVLRDNIVGFHDIGVIIRSLRDDLITLFKNIREYDSEFLKNLDKLTEVYGSSELAVIISDDMKAYNENLDKIEEELQTVKDIQSCEGQCLKQIILAVSRIDKIIPNVNSTTTQNKIYLGMDRLIDAAIQKIMTAIYTYLAQGTISFTVEEESIDENY